MNQCFSKLLLLRKAGSRTLKIEILKFTATLLVIKIDSNMSFGEDKEDVILKTYC